MEQLVNSLPTAIVVSICNFSLNAVNFDLITSAVQV